MPRDDSCEQSSAIRWRRHDMLPSALHDLHEATRPQSSDKYCLRTQSLLPHPPEIMSQKCNGASHASLHLMCIEHTDNTRTIVADGF